MIDGNYVMRWGLFKGKIIANVPPDYLLWIYQENKAHGAVREYIKLNLAAIRTQISRQKQLANR